MGHGQCRDAGEKRPDAGAFPIEKKRADRCGDDDRRQKNGRDRSDIGAVARAADLRTPYIGLRQRMKYEKADGEADQGRQDQQGACADQQASVATLKGQCQNEGRCNTSHDTRHGKGQRRNLGTRRKGNEAQDIPLVIAYEDEHLIVIDQPGGVVVPPAAGNLDGPLVNALLHYCGGSLSGIGGVARPGIVHRIDKDPSGLMVAATTDRTHEGLAKQFAAHSIDRRYRAIPGGFPRPADGTVDAPLARSPQNRKKVAIVQGGKRAVTHYRTIEKLNNAALVECRLETGRTHQVRVHMQSLGHALLGPFALSEVEVHGIALADRRTLGFDFAQPEGGVGIGGGRAEEARPPHHHQSGFCSSRVSTPAAAGSASSLVPASAPSALSRSRCISLATKGDTTSTTTPIPIENQPIRV